MKRSGKAINKQTHPFFALTIIIGVAFLASFIIPSGEYTREVIDGVTRVDPSSYTQVEKIIPSIADLFLSLYHGFGSAASLMALVLFVGGAFGVVKKIGLMDVTIKLLIRKLEKYGIVPVILSIMLIMALIVSFTGVWELSLVVVPLVIPLCLSLGYDDMTGFAIVAAGDCAVLGPALANPFFTAVGHNLAELPVYSGMWYRLVSMIVLYIPTFFYVYRYAKRVKANPELSITKGQANKYEAIVDDGATFSGRQKLAGIVFLAIFVFMIYGTLTKGYTFAEMSACFVAMGLLVGLTYGCRLNDICYYFADGMQELMLGAFVMFFARSVLYLLEKTLVIDTIIHFLSQFFVGSNPLIVAALIFVVQTIINFLVPSGSGQAMLTLPILIPLADMGGITRQVACFASQMGDGLSNLFWPTNGALMALLAVGGIAYTKWLKFFAPLFALIVILTIILVVAAQAIQLGPM